MSGCARLLGIGGFEGRIYSGESVDEQNTCVGPAEFVR